MRAGKILVSGASIAGPAVAYWLEKAGHHVTVVERGAELRGAGQNIDVRGTAREVLRLMDVEAAALAAGTGEKGLRFVDESDSVLGEFAAGSSDSDGPTAELEVLRGVLAKLLVDAGGSGIEYVFGTRIVSVAQDADGVDVEFDSGERRRFDLLVIADGIRSTTRSLVFGTVELRELGLYTAYGTIARAEDDDDWWNWFNTVGGRSITLRPDNVGTTRVTLSFLSPPRGYEDLDAPRQRVALRRHFSDVGWKAPRILDALDLSDELYVDYNAQVRTERWSQGRVVLLGDAAWCATPLSGMGTTLALTGAYVLAGEIATRASYSDAFAVYREHMLPLVEHAQRLPPGTPRLAHPKSRAGVVALRTAVKAAASKPVRALAARFAGSGAAEETSLPPYSFGLR